MWLIHSIFTFGVILEQSQPIGIHALACYFIFTCSGINMKNLTAMIALLLCGLIFKFAVLNFKKV
jgi:hypothetical protein